MKVVRSLLDKSRLCINIVLLDCSEDGERTGFRRTMNTVQSSGLAWAATKERGHLNSMWHDFTTRRYALLEVWSTESPRTPAFGLMAEV